MCRLLWGYVQKFPPDTIRRIVPVLQGHFTVAILSINVFVPPVGHFTVAIPSINLFVPSTNGAADPRPSGSYSHWPAAQRPSNGRAGAGLEYAPPLRPRPVGAHVLSQARGVPPNPPYRRQLLISSRVAARALSDGSAAWAGKVLHSHLPGKWRRKVTSQRKREAEKAGAGYSGTGLGVPEAPGGGRRGSPSTRPNKSGSRAAGSAHAPRAGSASEPNVRVRLSMREWLVSARMRITEGRRRTCI